MTVHGMAGNNAQWMEELTKKFVSSHENTLEDARQDLNIKSPAYRILPGKRFLVLTSQGRYRTIPLATHGNLAFNFSNIPVTADRYNPDSSSNGYGEGNIPKIGKCLGDDPHFFICNSVTS